LAEVFIRFVAQNETGIDGHIANTNKFQKQAIRFGDCFCSCVIFVIVVIIVVIIVVLGFVFVFVSISIRFAIKRKTFASYNVVAVMASDGW
jgi:t-SNARE complex subunit (syntaxin)